MIGMTLFFLATSQIEAAKANSPSRQATEMMAPSRSTMIIDPKARANDYQKAFDLLRQEKSTSKVVFQLVDGTEIANVIDMKILPSDTLIVFRYNTPKGIKIQVVEIENLLGVSLQ